MKKFLITPLLLVTINTVNAEIAFITLEKEAEIEDVDVEDEVLSFTTEGFVEKADVAPG